MANTIEFIIKAVDQASQVVSQVEAKITTGAQGASTALNKLGKASEESAGGFSKMQSAIVTVNQGMQLASQVANQVSRAYDETVGKTIAYAKEVRDLSTNLGITAEETSKIIQASDDYGISVEAVTGALQMAVKRGFTPNIETLAKLADEYNNIASPTERAARLADVFGRGWTTLTPILKAGGQAIREAAGEAEKLGLVMSEKDVQSARALEIQIDNLNDRVDALKLKMGKELVPGLVTAAEDFTRLGDKIMGTEKPLDEARIVYDRIVKAFGEGSAAAEHARGEYEKLKRAEEDQVEAQQKLEKQLGRTNKEQQLQLAMLPPALNGYQDSTQAILDEDQAMKQYNDTLAKSTAAMMDVLKVGMAGAIQNELTQFNEKQDALKTKAAELQGVIETSYGKARDSAVTSLAEINKQLDGNAAAHEDATRRILFGYAEQQLSVDGLTSTEGAALDALAEKWGLKSKEDVAALQAIRDAAAGLAKDNSIEAFMGKLDRVSNKALNIKIVPEIDYRNIREAKLDKAITPKVDTTQAAKDIQAYTTDQVGGIPATKKTTAIFDTYQATQDTNAILKLFNTIPPVKKSEINVDGKAALQVLDDILLDYDRIYNKTVEVTIKYKTEGNRPSGFQRGIDMIVPPSPTGRTGDYFPFLAAAGERVTVQTPAQQMTPIAQGGDTYNYTTNVYNPLAAAMLADKQRRDRLARSNSRMGVT